MKVAAISDTHNHKLSSILKDKTADLLVIAGDVLGHGGMDEWGRFLRMIPEIRGQFKHVVYTPGNHDIYVQYNESLCQVDLDKLGVTLLIDDLVTIDNKLIYGSPWTPRFGGWAYMLEENEIKAKWDKVPAGLDLLITHGPPFGILDMTDGRYSLDKKGIHVGCKHLRNLVSDLGIAPRHHVTGHIHHAHGMMMSSRTRFYNVAICDEEYQPTQPVTEFEI